MKNSNISRSTPTLAHGEMPKRTATPAVKPPTPKPTAPQASVVEDIQRIKEEVFV